MAILAEVKTASGGAAWDKAAGWPENGVHGTTAYGTPLDYQHCGSPFKQTRGGSAHLPERGHALANSGSESRARSSREKGGWRLDRTGTP